MVSVRRHLAVVLAAVIWSAATASSAQQPPDPCANIQSNPADVTLQLAFKNGQTTFHQGELVSLLLTYTSSAAQKYFFESRNYDRSGRMNTEVFCVEPAALGRDPLTAYFNSGIFGGVGGGIGSTGPLSTSPSTAEIDLNEWKVLPPGQYRLRLQSHRVERGATRDETGSGRVDVPLWSNVIEFRVIAATPEWEAEQLRLAAEALDSGVDERVRRGARILRFLESEAATREMARRFETRAGQPPCCDLRFGLVGSPHRQLAIDGLKAALADPARPITIEFITTLALLEVTSNPDNRMLPFTGSNHDAMATQAARAREEYQRIATQYARQAMAALTKKSAAAQAETVNALLQAPASAALDRTALRKMLIASWDSLPARTRNDLLQYQWDDIGGPDMLPVLRQLANAPPVAGRQATAQQVGRGVAVARLYELAPAEARDLILREMVAPRGDLNINVLTLLPDRELPEIEEPIFARLRAGEGLETGFKLLERYGTARSFPEVQRAYATARGRWACEIQSSALRQFIKADPAFGAAEVEFAMTQRTETGCYTQLFKDLNEQLAVPAIERIAIAALDDSSLEVEGVAAQALGANGSPAAEAALWRRLEKLHETFKDRPEDLRPGPGYDDPRASNSMVEYALVNAIAKGQAWLSDRDRFTRLKGLTSPWPQSEIARQEAALAGAELDLRLSWPPYSRAMFYDLAGYSSSGLDRLIQKLKQFPRGRRIVCSLTTVEADRHRVEIEAIQQAARETGIVFEVRTR